MAVTPSRPVHFDRASADRVGFLPPRRDSNGPGGQAHVDVTYDNEGKQQRLRLQTGRFRRAFLNSYQQKPGAEPKLSMKILLHDVDNECCDVGRFVKHWQRPFEAKLLECATMNVKSWFGKDISRQRLEEYLNSPIKDAKDQETGEPTDAYPKSLRVKVNKRNGKPDLQMYRADQEVLTYEELEELLPRSEVECILEYPSVWFMNQMFGCTPVLKAIQVFPRDELVGYAFVREEEGGSAGPGDLVQPDAKKARMDDGEAAVAHKLL